MSLRERWLPHDLHYYWRGGASLLFNQAASFGLGLVVTLLFTNYASRETYGLMGYVFSVMGVAYVTSVPGADAAILYYAAKGQDGSLPVGTRLRLRGALLGSLALLVTGAVLYATGRPAEAGGVVAGAVLFPLIYATVGFQSYLQAKGRFGDFVRSNMLIELGKLLVVALGIWLLHLDGLALVALYLAAIAAMTAGVNGWHMRGKVDTVPPEFNAMARNLTAAAALGTAATFVDRLLVGTFFGLEPLAAYTLGVTLAEPVRSLGNAGARLLFPKVVRVDVFTRQFLKKFGLGLGLLALGLAATVVMFWIVLPWLQPIFFPSYHDTLDIVAWLVVAAALSTFSTIAMQVLWALPDLRPVYYSQIALPAARIIFVAAGGYLLGVAGVLAAQVGFYLLTAAALLLLVLWMFVRGKRARTAP